MEFLDAYFFSSGPILVALVTVVFLLQHAWPRLSGQKTNVKDTTFGNNQAEGISVSKEPEIPDGWWTERAVFDLERRALFSQSWIYVAHSTQFSKPGAYQSFEVAGFPIFVIRGKDDQIRAFHNVCRHRAYTITRKETGASTVLGCKYHGWSYDTLGRLVKAPQFDDVPGFEKSENGLYEVHTHITDHGFVFVNLNANKPVAFDHSVTSVLSEFAGSSGVGSKSKWVTGQTLPGGFNWKLGIQQPYTQDTKVQLGEQLSAVRGPSFATRLGRILLQKSSPPDCPLFPSTLLFYFENTNLWLSLTFFPASEASSQVRYDLFDNSPKAKTDESHLAKVVERVMQSLVERIESNFHSISGQPGESSLFTFRILDMLQEHSKLEKTRGELVMPATRQPKASSLFQQAEQLCKELDCVASGSSNSGVVGKLDW
ncbi:Aromatic-ring-hydroxylating dioxygenase alpha subunit [Penicillium capsulatum]|uniref:Aromatic-ring-hydroxylating dioxygenase alpha subunit n=1 Tax=Penicillium capsulatum TaxID=69766 RepID=A0A9W9ILU3_9EURO|nr:Aromatic-ring-hydroxylating dioxygenase alpha subunit [Penicillium capsulatum]KAJ6122025.1 Aromatic-ring-hydroxylating dioxygenase alpha subunit [Penicillium capsulatum]